MSKKLMYLFSVVLVLGLFCGVASADPFQQDPGPDGIVSMEAENYDDNVEQSGVKWEEVGPTGGFTGTAGMQVLGPSFYDPGYAATSPRLDYEINFVKTGTHYVWILAWADGGGDDSCHAGLDGEERPLSSNWSGGGNNWSNGRYPETGRAQFEVTTPGIHILNIWVREDGLIVDKIVLTTNPDYTPMGEGPEESHRGPRLKAYHPAPDDGQLYEDTWASLSWSAGETAVSHDVYFGENFDDVNDGTGDTFRGNQAGTFYIVGFPGYPYPDGLIPGTTYYWRIDEVEADGTTKHKGYVWSFTIPPKTAYDPDPAEGAEFVDPDVRLRWTAGFGAKLHTVYFGDNFDDVNDGVVGLPQATTTFTPGTLKLAKTYYWRIDEFDIIETHKGDVWSFTTQGGVGSPDPANGAVDVKQTSILTWTSGIYAASHQVYFGTDEDAVKNADTSSPEYKGTGDLGAQSYDPGKLELGVTYYWRIDEVNNVNPDSPWIGPVWSFTTTNLLIVDDFEDYDAGDNQIWYAWKDGLGYGTPGTDPYYAGNGSGSAVGDETTASFTEETIVHGGNQSMPLFYDNNQQGKFKYSEAELTLTYLRDWTENSINTLTIWFRGNPAALLEAPAGTYTMTASGVDIWGTVDEFRYAWKQLSGAGTISAQVLSVENTDPWAKAGVMIRQTLDPGSKFAAVYITPGNGCRFQARLTPGSDATSDTSVVTPEQTAITSPYWVKLERDAAGNFNGYYSSDGVSWQTMAWNPQRISMPPNVYIGLALTSHSSGVTCTAEFSNVQTTGTVTPMIWTQEAIGVTMAANDAEPMYVALNGNAVVFHDNPNAALIDTWTQWNIDLQAFADQGVNLANVNTIAIGFGDKKNPQPGGSGTAYFDDIRLYRLAP